MTDAVFYVLESLAGGLVNGFWISLLLVGLAAGVLRLIGQRRSVNASTRYGVWTMTLAAIIVAHVIGAGLAGSSVVDTKMDQPTESRLVENAVVEPPPAPVMQNQTGVPELAQESRSSDATGLDVVSSPQPPIETGAAGPSAAPGAMRAFSIDVSGGLFLLSALLMLIWFSRATAGLASVVSSWRHVLALKSNARELDPSRWRDLVPAHLRRSFSVAESADVPSPVAAGLIRPMILVPVGLRDRLTTDEFRQVLLHEVAHLERFDDWTILIQRIGEAVLWHHPGMWKVSSELQEAREISCDDWVVSRTRRPAAYVHSIGRMIELNLGTRSLQLAPGLAAERGDLMGRMRRILNQKMPESSRLSGEQIAVAGGLVALVLVLVAVFVPLTRLAFSFGDGEAVTYIFGESPDEVVRIQEVPTLAPISPLAPLAPIPPLPALPPLPDLPTIPAIADVPPLPPRVAPPAPSRAASFGLRETPAPPRVERTSGADLSVQSWIRILDSAAGVSSNGERMGLLRTALEKMPDDDRVVRSWLGAVKRMTSSGARSELLVQMVRTVTLDADRVDWIRSAASSIPSSSDRERVLRALSDTL